MAREVQRGSMPAWIRRVPGLIAELVLVAAGITVVFSSDKDQVSPLVLWDGVAFLYLGVGMIILRRHTVRGDQIDGFKEMGKRDRPWWARTAGIYFAFSPMLFSVLGLTAALEVLFANAEIKDELLADTLKGAGALAMVFAWMLLHVSYSRRYQWLYRRHRGGLEFPGNEGTPKEADFVYFAMTLGSSFATSDVNVTSTRMRWHVMVHSVISFFYNAIVLAVAFRILTGG